MKSPKFFRIIFCITLWVFVTTFSNAAENNSLTIPRIDGGPTLADFTGMSPNSSLARSMSKAENFTQREPDVGEPSSQRTEVYIGYDDENFYTIFLAFDSIMIGMSSTTGYASPASKEINSFFSL